MILLNGPEASSGLEFSRQGLCNQTNKTQRKYLLTSIMKKLDFEKNLSKSTFDIRTENFAKCLDSPIQRLG